MFKLKASSRSTQLLFISIFVLLVAGAVWLASEAAADPIWQARVAEAGYLGVFGAGVVGGLNFIIPIPPATLTPLFVASGIGIPAIIILLALGTVVADFTGYMFGRVGRKTVEAKYPRTFAFFTRAGQEYRWYLLPMVMLYAAFVPFPNEAILIPLAVSGIRFSLLLPALMTGNLLHQLTLVYGISSLSMF